jgi:membrane-associated protease RseP (regulator of RpoE activity)
MPANPSDATPLPRPSGRALSVPLLLYLATCGSVLWTGSGYANGHTPATLGELGQGWSYALSLMSILTCHEFGHYIAARRHGVAASLPYFLPLPLLSPFGTLGAVITMPPIRGRNALLDVGAAGPLAGLALAIPVLWKGLSLSVVAPSLTSNYVQEGKSVLYWLLQRAVWGPIPDGYDVVLHPMALAGWVGLFITMINLIPWGQLDGGHIAYRLLSLQPGQLRGPGVART